MFSTRLNPTSQINNEDSSPGVLMPGNAEVLPVAAWASYHCPSGIDQPRQIYDFYPDAVIGGKGYKVSDIDALEIHGVKEIILPSGQVHFSISDEMSPQSFSLYVHLKKGGIECVGDFSFPSDAETCARILAETYDWPVHNYVAALMS